MKKFLRPILCSGVLTALLCTPALAVEQGDFSLLVNGEPVAFTDAAPVLKDGRSFLPMVATFEALGFAEENMTWDSETQTVTATKDGVAVILTIGQQSIQVERTDGTAGSSASTDVAPYIDAATSRTYIPVGLVADALGYRVGWDQETATVIIDDVDAILDANSETYELMDQYMEYAQKYSEGNYEVNGSIAMDIDAPDTTMGVTGDYNMILSQAAFQFDTELSMEMNDSGTQIELPNIDMDLRCDLETGMFYFQSVALAQSETWFSMDMKTLYEEVYGPGFYEQLLALNDAGRDMTFTQALSEILRSDALPLTSEVTTRDYLAAFNLILGDSRFQKSGSTYTNTFEENGMSLSFMLYTSGNRVNGYGMEMAAVDTELGYDFTILVEMRGDDMTMTMDFQMPDLSMTMEMDGAYQSTRADPETMPPVGAEVTDLMEFILGSGESAPEILEEM